MALRASIKLFLVALYGLPFLVQSQNLNKDFYKYKNNRTHTYEETIYLYQTLAEQYPNASLYEIGKTDIGKPLHLFIINETIESIQKSDKVKLFINNGIHPGEPCGIDASLLMAKDILEKKLALNKNVAIAIIPIYNVDGAINRGTSSRANQNGPVEYGFRGNHNNLDLNRDFIKMDSRNAKSFVKAFHIVDPHVIVDTHTTNGADYEYNMTLLPTAIEQLPYPMGKKFKQEIIPTVFERMKNEGEECAPYVYLKEKTPEDGILAYYDSPRYTTGYASLFHCWGFTTEAHMLKSFEKRVEATYTFLKVILGLVSDKASEIKNLKNEAIKNSLFSWHPIRLENDLYRYENRTFKGYKNQYKKSDVTGDKRLYYDTKNPKTFETKHFNSFKVTDSMNVPDHFIIPQSRYKIVEFLVLNGCEIKPLKQDTIIEAKTYYVERIKSSPTPYEGHFYHHEIEAKPTVQKFKFYAGDFIITPDEKTAKFLVHVLSPKARDSYLRWNFFDEIFQQKEWFSTYIFEDTAAEILENNPKLKAQFEEKKATDEDFSSNSYEQLYFIYKNSKYYENTHQLYPVYRVQQYY